MHIYICIYVYLSSVRKMPRAFPSQCISLPTPRVHTHTLTHTDSERERERETRAEERERENILSQWASKRDIQTSHYFKPLTNSLQNTFSKSTEYHLRFHPPTWRRFRDNRTRLYAPLSFRFDGVYAQPLAPPLQPRRCRPQRRSLCTSSERNRVDVWQNAFNTLNKQVVARNQLHGEGVHVSMYVYVQICHGRGRSEFNEFCIDPLRAYVCVLCVYIVRVRVCVCVWVCVHVRVHVCMYVYMHACMHICMHVWYM